MKKDSADGRLLIARVSMEMVRKTPVFGCGISGFRTEYLNQQTAYFESHPDSPYLINADDVETPFNEFLKILIEQGIIGLLLFLCLLYYLFEKENRRIAGQVRNDVIHFSIILFILIFGLFSYPFDKLPFVVLFIFSFALLSRNRNPVFEFRLKKMNNLKIPLLLIICLVSCTVAWNAHNYSKSCRTWNRALVNFSSGREESLSQLKNLYPELENNPVFLTTYGKALGFGGKYSESIITLEQAVKRMPLSLSYIELGKSYEAAGFPDKALECWKHAGCMVPARFTPLYLTMKLHFKNEEYELARKCAEELLAKKIKIDKPEIDEMKREAIEILNFQLSTFSF